MGATDESVAVTSDADAETLWHGLVVWFESIAADIERDLTSQTGLSTADFQILARLRSSSDGTLEQLALRHELHWSASRLSHQLKRMRHRGYLAHRETGRGTRMRISLTEAGKAVIDQSARIHAEAVRRHLLEKLTPQHREALAAAVSRNATD